MTALTVAELLLLFLPFLLSLAGQPAMPKMLCLVASVLAVLLSVEPYGAVWPCCIGMIIAVVSVRDSMQRRGLI